MTSRTRPSSTGSSDRRRPPAWSSPAPARAAAVGREQRGAGLAARARDHEHVAEGALVRVARPRAAAARRPSPASRRRIRGATAVDRLGGNADVDDLEVAAQLDARVEHLADLRVARTSPSPSRAPPRRAARPVSADRPDGDVDREDGAPAALIGVDHRRAATPSTGAFRPVPRSASTTTPARASRRAQRVELRRLVSTRDATAAAPAPRASRPRRRARRRRGRPARPRRRGARGAGVAPPRSRRRRCCRLPQHDHDRSAGRGQRRRSTARRALPRPLHQDGARRAVLDRPAIERPHLRRA